MLYRKRDGICLKVALLKKFKAVDALLLLDKFIYKIFLEKPSMAECRTSLHQQNRLFLRDLVYLLDCRRFRRRMHHRPLPRRLLGFFSSNQNEKKGKKLILGFTSYSYVKHTMTDIKRLFLFLNTKVRNYMTICCTQIRTDRNVIRANNIFTNALDQTQM